MAGNESILFMISIITCLVGVLTFISGMMKQSKNDGILTNKVDMALKGIDEIKASLNENTIWRREISTKVEAHKQNIKTLFSRCEDLQKEIDDLWKENRKEREKKNER